MKKYYLIMLPLVILACNSNQPSPSTHSSQSSSHKALPELSTGTKTDFKKSTYLPPGIESIFGKLPYMENGFYKFSFPRQDLKVMLEGV